MDLTAFKISRIFLNW